MNKNIVFIISGLLLTACSSTPTGQIESFGIAAGKVTDNVDVVLKEYREAGIQQEIISLSQEGTELTIDDLKPLNKRLIKAANYKSSALTQANKELNSYVKSLVSLATARSREEYALIAAKLSTSITGMNEQYKVLSGKNTEALSEKSASRISRVVSQIGSFYTQKKQAEALKEIIINTDDAVQELGRAINEEFLHGIIERKLYQIRAQELRGILTDYNAALPQSTTAQRQVSLALIKDKYVALQASAASVTQARRAVKSVVDAHSKLRTEMEKNVFSSKEIFRAIGDIKDINSGFDDVEELIRTCDNGILTDSTKGLICKA